jgi:hypothetical protein
VGTSTLFARGSHGAHSALLLAHGIGGGRTGTGCGAPRLNHASTVSVSSNANGAKPSRTLSACIAQHVCMETHVMCFTHGMRHVHGVPKACLLHGMDFHGKDMFVQKGPCDPCCAMRMWVLRARWVLEGVLHFLRDARMHLALHGWGTGGVVEGGARIDAASTRRCTMRCRLGLVLHPFPEAPVRPGRSRQAPAPFC